MFVGGNGWHFPAFQAPPSVVRSVGLAVHQRNVGGAIGDSYAVNETPHQRFKNTHESDKSHNSVYPVCHNYFSGPERRLQNTASEETSKPFFHDSTWTRSTTEWDGQEEKSKAQLSKLLE